MTIDVMHHGNTIFRMATNENSFFVSRTLPMKTALLSTFFAFALLITAPRR